LGKDFKELKEENSAKIKQIIKKFTGEYNEDLEQETYLKTWQNLDKYKELNKFSQWICTICANLCRDYLKSSKRQAFDSALINNEELDLTRAKAKDNPEHIYTLKERQKIILNAINKLPKKLKEVIILYEFEEYSYQDISEKLKIPTGTVKSRLNSARNSLKETLSFLM